MSQQKVVWVDSFTDQPFAGNPAAVCVVEEALDATRMQLIARELSLSETAFVQRRGRDGADFDLRWFTPAAEVELCGHATLASAHALWQDGFAGIDETISFHCLSGVLTCKQEAGWIEMDFPIQKAEASTAPSEIWKAIDAVPKWVGKNPSDYLIEVDSEETLLHIQPDMSRLEAIPARGFIVTSPPSEERRAAGVDFVSRFFGPAVGVPEDPVTGSAHCCLAPFWGERLGKEEMVGYQASERGGTVRVRWNGGDRVQLRGQAVTVLRAELLV